jgi:hypothetical protein
LPPAAREVDVALLTEAARAVMLARQRAVDAVREMQATLIATGMTHTRAEVLARTRAASEHGTTPGTLARWIRAYRAGGLDALAPRWGLAHRGRSSLDPVVQDFIFVQYLSLQQPRISTVYRRVKAHCHEHELGLPSASVVRRFCRAIPPAAQIYHRHGPETWRQIAMPRAERDLEAVSPGEWYVGDNRVFDVFVRVHRSGRWTAIRPWVSAWLDIGSRDLVGWAVVDAPNSSSIAAAARMAIRTYGAPTDWYYDNGKDYRSKYLSGPRRRGAAMTAPLTDVALGIFREMGSKIHFCTPFNPPAKLVERWFGFKLEWEKTLPGWCGNTPAARPEKLAGELSHVMGLLTLEQFTQAFGRFVETYRTSDHGSLGVTPASKWEGVTRRIPTDDALTVLLMEERQATVTTQGISLWSRKYWADELAGCVGERLTVRYDRSDVGRLYVFRGHALLCEATNLERLQQGATRETLAAEARRKSRARQIVKRFPEIAREAFGQGGTMTDAIHRSVAASRAREAATAQAAPTAPTGPVMPLITKHDQAGRQIRTMKRRISRAIPTPHPTPQHDERQRELVKQALHQRRGELEIAELERERAEVQRHREQRQQNLQIIRDQAANGMTQHLDMVPRIEAGIADADRRWADLSRRIKETADRYGLIW